jgi:la-related protein 1
MADKTVAAANAGFSYAQAAKARAAATSAANSPQNASTENLPNQASKDAAPSVDEKATSVNGTAPTEADAVAQPVIKDALNKPSINTSKPTLSSTTSRPSTQTTADPSNPSSPSFGTASTSTLPIAEDFASTPNTSSESTWDKQSQSSNIADKSSESTIVETDSEKGKSEPKEVKKVFVAAPVPSVNPWSKRREEQLAKAKLEPVSSESTEQPQTNGDGSSPARQKKQTNSPVRDRRRESTKGSEALSTRSRDEPRRTSGRHKGEKSPVAAVAPPPIADTTLWPTPDTASQEPTVKEAPAVASSEKPNEAASVKGLNIHTKGSNSKKWVSVPFTPTPVFQTPLPQRKAGGGPRADRGQKDGGPRRSSHNSYNPDKSAAGADSSDAADHSKSKSEMPAQREFSKDTKTQKRSSSTGPSREVRKGSYDRPKPGDGADTDRPRNGFIKPAPRTNDFHADTQRGREEIRAVNGQDRHVAPAQSWPPKQDSSNNAAPEGNGYARAPSSDQARGRSGHFRDGSFNSSRDGPSRGPDRGGRGGFRGGRGGSHNFVNTNQGNYQNHHNGGISSQLSSPAFSPQGHQFYSPTQFNNGQFPVPQQNQQQQQRNYRNNGRANTVPNTPVMYGRYGSGFGPLPQMNTQMPMFDYHPGQTMSAMPLNAADPYTVLAQLEVPLEYYFSIDNLCKDIHLRKHMDSQGYLPLSIIASFNQIRLATQDINLVRHAIIQSPNIEFLAGHDGIDRLRKAEGWEQWVLPMEERDPQARVDGPPARENIQITDRPPMRSPSESVNGSSNHSFNGDAAAFVPGQAPETANGHVPETKLSAESSTFQPLAEQSRKQVTDVLTNTASSAFGPDIFSNEQADNQLFVATRKIHPQRINQPPNGAAPMPFNIQANGSPQPTATTNGLSA